MKKMHWFVFFAGLFLKCDAGSRFQVKGYSETYTAGGKLYVKVQDPSFFVVMPDTLRLGDHSWMTRNDVARDAELVPLQEDAKDLIVELINNRRAKLMMGLYFNKDRPADWGVLPPAVNLRKVVWDEELAQKITTPYTKKFIFKHNTHKQYGIYPKMGENIRMEIGRRYVSPDDYEEMKDFLKESFDAWFDDEIRYYKHFKFYNTDLLDDLVQTTFVDPLEQDDRKTAEQKRLAKGEMKYGHMTALTVPNMISVGCAVAVRPTHKEGPGYEGYLDRIIFCNFGGDAPITGIGNSAGPLYPMDECFLEEYGISKSIYDNPV